MALITQLITSDANSKTPLIQQLHKKLEGDSLKCNFYCFIFVICAIKYLEYIAINIYILYEKSIKNYICMKNKRII